MKTALVPKIIFLLALIAVAPARAGRLGSELANTIDRSPSDSLISVWIEMNPSDDRGSLKAAVADAATRAEAHALASTELRRRSEVQKNLLEHLSAMKSSGRADRIKGHWIVNVVEAQITADQLAELSKRDDILNIYLEPTVVSLEATETSADDEVASPDSSTSNLRHIRAHEAWAMGFTGAGRLVCNFDTGVQGLHPALYSRWKGLDGDSAAAWFDPYGQQPFPHYYTTHGTHTMGIMVGANPSTPDTVGVAPGARWIAAAVVDVSGASTLEAFEWAADPDGNPNTVADVPDVINHSWGYTGFSCLNIYYTAIENTEALGIVNIFSAGNSGPNAQTITAPADRALDSIDCFAVGNLTHTTDVIYSNSSHGPSPCDGSSIKPNVIAPGASIRSCGVSYLTTPYVLMSGTSMAAPHVSGLVALLRQKNPNATVDQIKTAILTTTRRAGTWGTMPNNTYGWGEIDCVAALNALSATNTAPHLRVYDLEHAAIAPGDTIYARVRLQNLGTAVTGVTAFLRDINDAITILDGTLTFGNIGAGSVVRSTDSIRVIVSDTVTEGSALVTDLVVDRGAVNDTLQLTFLVGAQPVKSLATHTAGRIEFSLSDFGAFGLSDNAMYPHNGSGFKFDGGADDLYEGGLMIGASYTDVSSSVHSYLMEPDMDFEVAPSGGITLSDPGAVAAQQTWAMFNDSKANYPLDILVTQESFQYDAPNNDFITLRYIIRNMSALTLSDLYVGLYMDWDLTSYVYNAGGFETDGAFVWQAYNGGTTETPVLSRFRGLKVLQGQRSAAGAIDTSVYRHYPLILVPPGDGYTTDEKYSTLTCGTLYADINKSARKDLFSIIAAGPLSLAPDAQDTVTFAIMAATTLDSLRGAALRADSILTDVDDPDDGSLLPDEFTLYQNYPNPFNPTTTIVFDLPVRSRYKLEVFNVLGQNLFETEAVARAGRVEIPWSGDGCASGAYFYRVTIGEHSITRKMMLLK